MGKFWWKLWRQIHQHSMVVFGFFCIIVGFITWPLPTPIGLPLIFIGTLILLKYSRWAKRRYLYMRSYAHKHRPRLSKLFIQFEQTILRKHKPKVRLMPEPLQGTAMTYPSIEQFVGNTPLVKLQRLPTGTNTVLVKLEGNNPAGSVKDRPALNMIVQAEKRGDIRPGDTLIEATSGNTGIALAMAAAMRGYRMVLVMPENMSAERRGCMKAFGAELVLTSAEGSMEEAIDTAQAMQASGKGKILDQFSNPDNPAAHYQTTGPEIWQATQGTITHFVSAMGTTGTIMGTSRYLKEQNPAIQIIGVHPEEGAKIPGIRRWPAEYLPKIFEPSRVDSILDMSQQRAEETTRALGVQEGIFCGISSGGAVAAALQVAATTQHAVIVCIICDRGDRYLSTGVFPT